MRQQIATDPTVKGGLRVVGYALGKRCGKAVGTMAVFGKYYATAIAIGAIVAGIVIFPYVAGQIIGYATLPALAMFVTVKIKRYRTRRAARKAGKGRQSSFTVRVERNR